MNYPNYKIYDSAVMPHYDRPLCIDGVWGIASEIFPRSDVPIEGSREWDELIAKCFPISDAMATAMMEWTKG